MFPSLRWNFYHVAPEKTIYLTFDDGPHPEITPWVIEQLQRHEMKATFFCIGDNARKFPETFQHLIKAEMGIGNHTMHHLKGWSCSTSVYLQNISMAEDFIGKTTLFRPPYGRITPNQVNVLHKEKQIVMWSMVTGDWNNKMNIRTTLEALKKNTRSGFIPVFHDSEKAWHQLRQLLPPYLAFLSENNWKSDAIHPTK